MSPRNGVCRCPSLARAAHGKKARRGTRREDVGVPQDVTRIGIASMHVRTRVAMLRETFEDLVAHERLA